jgi:hypothetical protein
MIHPLVTASAGANELSLTGPEEARVGQPSVLTATVRHGAGQTAANAPLVFKLRSGPNTGFTGTCAPADCRSDADGRVTGTYLGSGAGQDTVVVFQDTDGDGAGDAGEPSATVTITWERAPNGIRITPASGPPGTVFTMRYSCAQGLAPLLSVKAAGPSSLPVEHFEIGLPSRERKGLRAVGSDGTRRHLPCRPPMWRHRDVRDTVRCRGQGVRRHR